MNAKGDSAVMCKTDRQTNPIFKLFGYTAKLKNSQNRLWALMRGCRLPAAHKALRLMLLGSPPDMVHETSSHRIHIPA